MGELASWRIGESQTASHSPGRREGTSAPQLRSGIIAGKRTSFDVVESTAGFRTTPDLTLRGSYGGRRFYATAWDHQGGVSVEWAHLWY